MHAVYPKRRSYSVNGAADLSFCLRAEILRGATEARYHYPWKFVISETQSGRDQIGAAGLRSFLAYEEVQAIRPENNSHIFPELVASKGYLRSKDYAAAAAFAVPRAAPFTPP